MSNPVTPLRPNERCFVKPHGNELDSPNIHDQKHCKTQKKA